MVFSLIYFWELSLLFLLDVLDTLREMNCLCLFNARGLILSFAHQDDLILLIFFGVLIADPSLGTVHKTCFASRLTFCLCMDFGDLVSLFLFTCLRHKRSWL